MGSGGEIVSENTERVINSLVVFDLLIFVPKPNRLKSTDTGKHVSCMHTKPDFPIYIYRARSLNLNKKKKYSL